MMTEWILIMILSHGSFESGIAVEKVVFDNEKECSRAADHVVGSLQGGYSAYKSSKVFCIARSKLK